MGLRAAATGGGATDGGAGVEGGAGAASSIFPIETVIVGSGSGAGSITARGGMTAAACRTRTTGAGAGSAMCAAEAPSSRVGLGAAGCRVTGSCRARVGVGSVSCSGAADTGESRRSSGTLVLGSVTLCIRRGARAGRCAPSVTSATAAGTGSVWRAVGSGGRFGAAVARTGSPVRSSWISSGELAAGAGTRGAGLPNRSRGSAVMPAVSRAGEASRARYPVRTPPPSCAHQLDVLPSPLARQSQDVALRPAVGARERVDLREKRPRLELELRAQQRHEVDGRAPDIRT